MRFRTLNRWYAAVAGYFWLPCPLCGQCFGGHEWRVCRKGHESAIPDPERPGGGIAICRDCTSAGRGCIAYARRDGTSWHGCAEALNALGVAE